MSRSRKIGPGGTRGSVFREAARNRRDDAAVLFHARRYAGAIYLAGYSVECLLKWAVTVRRNVLRLPADLETHNLDKLLAESGLVEMLKSNHLLFAMYSELAHEWGTDLRYLANLVERNDAERLYRQMNQIYGWINEQTI